MTVGELIEMLEGMDEDAEVRFAHQPCWAFEYSISDVVEVELDQDDNGQYHQGHGVSKVVYIAEGTQLGYLPGAASEQLGWR